MNPQVLFCLIAGLLSAPATAQTNPNPQIFYLDGGNILFRPYSKMPMRLGNGFKAMGADTLITVKLIGNDATDSGTLYFLDPITGAERLLFSNKDTARFGEEVILGKGLRGAPIVFKYVNSTDGKAKYTGANTPGADGYYRFDDDPILRTLAINNKPIPVSEQVNGMGDRRWAVAGRASRTAVLFGFEDLAQGRGHDFNDIVFLLTGVQLDSEIKLPSPLVTESGRTSKAVQVSLTMPAQATSPDMQIFYTVDGSAPIFDDNGPVGSATRIYAGPFTVTGNSVIKALAMRPSIEDSTTGVTRYLPSDLATYSIVFASPVRVAGGVYLDENGDGRIDAARIVLRDSAIGLPPHLFLEDPFRGENEIELNAKDLSLATVPGTLLFARFPDRPFAFGTGFPNRAYATFPSGVPAYPAGTFHLADSVGPVLSSVEASPPLAGNPAWMQAVFSEDVRVDLEAKAFPFAIRRGALPDPNGRIAVTAIRQVDARTYLYHFALESAFYPVPGDSLRLLPHPSIRDLRALVSNMSYHVDVHGPAASLRGDIAAMGGDFTVGEVMVNPRPVKVPVSVVQVVEGGPAGGGLVCLDCRTGEWRAADSERPSLMPNGPRIDIRTRGPFAFDVAFFTHLGVFVNRARGTVTASMLVGVPLDAEGNKHVSLMWYPVSEKGSQAGTGVYVAQGTYQSLAAPGLGRQGEPVRLAPARSRIGIRFGYVRK